MYYWHRRQNNSTAAVDYLTAAAGRVVPIEVKAGKAGRLRSLAVFADRYGPPVAVRVYAGPFPRDRSLLSVPLYGLERLHSLLAVECRRRHALWSEASRGHDAG